MAESISNVLAQRYASPAMKDIWGEKRKIILERQLWVAALAGQMQLNPALGITDADVMAYRQHIEAVDVDSIARREAVTRHDVKARIEEFNALAGGGRELIHQGFTSRDLTDNVELLQMAQALKLLRMKSIAVIFRLHEKAREYRELVVCGRSHNVPGQATTLGKRMATLCEEMLFAFDRFDNLLDAFPLRGIKGPMGTQQDMADLLEGAENARTFEMLMAEHLGLRHVLESTGQVYPRSIDYLTVSTFYGLASAPSNLANLIRLMVGPGLLHEGFGEGQTGSSGMPHKMNPRTSERITALRKVLWGQVSMLAALVGEQWYEGDVSCSAVRRVALADACFTLDGILEATLTVLKEMEVFPDAIANEVATYMPFLSTTAILMAALKKGMGREAAHSAIKEHSLQALRDLRTGGGNTLVRRLADDDAFPLSKEEIEVAIRPNVGRAIEQVDDMECRVAALASADAQARTYEPAPIR
jgi:adenylosuccinate lyase